MTQQIVLNNIASIDPTSNDDIVNGYTPGSTWLNSNTQTLFTCYSASPYEAIWLPVQVQQPFNLGTELDAPSPITDGRVAGINYDGTVKVGFTTASGNSTAHVWDINNVRTNLANLAGSVSSQALAISTTGLIVGTGVESAVSRPVYWLNGVINRLPVFTATNLTGTAQCVSDDGSVIGGFVLINSVRKACYWVNNNLRILPSSDVKNSEAICCSVDGSIMAGYEINGSNQEQPVMWTNGIKTYLNVLDPAHAAGRVFDMSGNGTIMVGRSADITNKLIATFWRSDLKAAAYPIINGGTVSVGRAISHNTQYTVGFNTTPTDDTASLWFKQAGQLTGTVLSGTFTGAITRAICMSGDGKTAGGFSDDPTHTFNVPFLWTSN